MLASPAPTPPGPLASTAHPALRVQGLERWFDDPEGGRVLAVRLARLELARGEQLAVTGESGSGKTTLLHLIAGLLPATAGRIEIGGEPMTGRSESERDRLRAARVGYLFQAFHLLPELTALENVTLGLTFRPRGERSARLAARASLERVGLGQRLHHRPHQLSTGQQQRVALARALAGRPLLLLADEPTASLDRARAEACLDLLLEFAAEAGAATVVVTHDVHALSRFPRRVDLTPAGPGAGT